MTARKPIQTLNLQHERFVAEYVASHHGTRSAIGAGYSAKSAAAMASKLLKEPAVRAAIEEQERGIADALGMTAHWAMTRLKETIESAMVPVPKVNRNGDLIIIPGKDGAPAQMLMEVDRQAALRGLELLMKARGMFVERSEITVAASVEYTLSLDSELKPSNYLDEGETP